jgi:hypothetical protein
MGVQTAWDGFADVYDGEEGCWDCRRERGKGLEQGLEYKYIGLMTARFMPEIALEGVSHATGHTYA